MLGRGGQPVELKLQEAEAFVEGGVELDMIGYAGLPPRHRHAAPAVPQSTCGSAEVAACGLFLPSRVTRLRTLSASMVPSFFSFNISL